jgi:hypothetical protein
MIRCEECAKKFKTQQGLVGHLRFVHGIKKDKQAPLFPPKRFITDDELSKALGTIVIAVNQLMDFRNEQYKMNEAYNETLKMLSQRVLNQYGS